MDHTMAALESLVGQVGHYNLRNKCVYALLPQMITTHYYNHVIITLTDSNSLTISILDLVSFGTSKVQNQKYLKHTLSLLCVTRWT